MFVQPISFSISASNINTNSQKSINKPEFKYVQKADSFQPSFGSGYKLILESIASVNYSKDKKVEEAFGILFHELINEPQILEKAGFIEIVDVYKKGGFRGLMQELWVANPEAKIKKIVEKAEFEPQTLVLKDEIPILEIMSFGRQGFWNTLFNRKNAPRDTRLLFSTPDKRFLMEFGMDKHGECAICQKRPGETVFTTFHNSTGNRKSITRQPHGTGNPETFYYNPDGSDNEFKNHIQGGSIINIW